MLTPYGQPANKLEKVMLLSLWANYINEEIKQSSHSNKKKFIFAGIGKPTYPINSNTITSYLNYWQNLLDLTKKWHNNADEIYENVAIDYGDPLGDKEPRALMAQVMSAWYESEIFPENILFTVGGLAGIRAIFETFNTHYEEIPGYRIITPFPHYSAYSHNSYHRLHPIDVLKEPGYKVTAHALEESIKEAYLLAETDHGLPIAVLICNPSNPIGNIVDKDELVKIANVLRCYPDLHIIFDEAYTEMSFIEMTSFLKVAPDLKKRVILLRSATKALSAAGERMAILIVFDENIMHEILNKNISYFIHAPRSAQIAYAQTMAEFKSSDQEAMSQFYKKKVNYVIERLKNMGASMPDPTYAVEATFYALGNFSDLFGLELPPEVQQVMQNTGNIKTGEELAYYLLFKDSLMIAPLSYFGLSPDSGYIRITCSGDDQELKDLMDRLEQRLFKARKSKKMALIETISQKLSEVAILDKRMHEIICEKIAHLESIEDSCLSLKAKNQTLNKLQSTIAVFLGLMDE